MNLIEQVKAAIEDERTSTELDELAVQLKMHTNTTAKRLKAIIKKDGDTFGGGAGPERKKAIDAGDLDAIRAMSDEERDLISELEVLRNLQKRLRSHFDTAKANESVEAAGARYAEFGKQLADEAKKEADLQASRRTTDAMLRDLTAGRVHVARASNLEVPAADDTLLALFMRTRGFVYSRGPHRIGWYAPTSHPRQLQQVAEALGVAVPHPESVAA